MAIASDVIEVSQSHVLSEFFLSVAFALLADKHTREVHGASVTMLAEVSASFSHFVASERLGMLQRSPWCRL